MLHNCLLISELKCFGLQHTHTHMHTLVTTYSLSHCHSALPKIITTGYKALNLQYFFTCGHDEVRAWTVMVSGVLGGLLLNSYYEFSLPVFISFS